MIGHHLLPLLRLQPLEGLTYPQACVITADWSRASVKAAPIWKWERDPLALLPFNAGLPYH